MAPTQRVEPGEIVREGVLQLRRVRAKSPGSELQSVHVGILVGGRQIDADVRARDGCFVIELVADDVYPKPEFIHKCVAEEMRLRDAAEPAVQRNAEGEIEIVRARQATGLDSVGIRSERLEGRRVRPEEANGEVILAAAKVTVPVGSELIVGKFARIRNGECALIQHSAARFRGCIVCLRNTRGSRGRREQETARSCSKLMGLVRCVQQGQGNGVDRGERYCRAIGDRRHTEYGLEVRGRAVGRQYRNARVDVRSRRIAAALPRPLVVHVEEAEFAIGSDRAAEVASENVLLDLDLAQKIVVRVESCVPEILPGVAVEFGGSAAKSGVDVPSPITPLAGVIETGRNFEFLDRVGVGQRCVSQFPESVVCGRNAVDQVVVVVFPPAVDMNKDLATAKLGRVV